ncbi:SRSF protein kinase 3 [Apiospora rasikravindrae]|uniref:SRSF protein kinase 3 n=1 Tax=Apiospora rasikravindrae TaxID=990691 RepID=A0ABR1TFI0_9PEZI
MAAERAKAEVTALGMTGPAVIDTEMIPTAMIDIETKDDQAMGADSDQVDHKNGEKTSADVKAAEASETREERHRTSPGESSDRDRSSSPRRSEFDGEGRMYCYIPGEELEHEDKERYRPGGFHPIMLGDRIGHQGRYKIVDKLGWGYGSTVWLCKDSDIASWRAVKVLQASDSNEENQELKIFKLLEHVDREELEQNHVGLPESYFWQDGPNGRHLCFVSKLVAAFDSQSPPGYGVHSPTLLVELCFQLAKAVKYLHDKGICHGDIRTQNIGLRLDDAAEKLSQRELQQHIGDPLRYSVVKRLSGRPAYPHAPGVMFQSRSVMPLEPKYRTGKLVLIDFGLSYETAKLPPEQMSYRSNAAPELLFKRSPRGPATDLWALSCVFVQLRTSQSLVSEFDTWVRVLQGMEWCWGPLPETYRSNVSAKMEEFDEYSVDKERETPWKPGDPLSIPMSLETYQRAKINGSGKTETMRHFLNQAEQRFKYHLTDELIPHQLTFYDGTSDGFSSDEDDSSIKLGKRKTSTSSHTTTSPEPHGDKPTTPVAVENTVIESSSDGTTTEQVRRADIQRAMDRGRPYSWGNFPDSSDPCVCDWDDARGGRSMRVAENCTAEQHWYGDPDRIVVWQMSKNEQRVLGDLLEGMFKYDPEERLTTEQVINHRWFKQRREAIKE